MSESISGFGRAITAALAPSSSGIDPTPLRRSQAISALVNQEKYWLDNTHIVTFIDFLRTDQTAADIYMALTDKGVQKAWVHTQLEKLGVLIF